MQVLTVCRGAHCCDTVVTFVCACCSPVFQDRFFTELRESGDGFSVVADHFGRGLMNMTAGAISLEALSAVGVPAGSALSLAGLTR